MLYDSSNNLNVERVKYEIGCVEALGRSEVETNNTKSTKCIVDIVLRVFFACIHPYCSPAADSLLLQRFLLEKARHGLGVSSLCLSRKGSACLNPGTEENPSGGAKFGRFPIVCLPRVNEEPTINKGSCDRHSVGNVNLGAGRNRTHATAVRELDTTNTTFFLENAKQRENQPFGIHQASNGTYILIVVYFVR